MIQYHADRAFAEKMDAADPLAFFRERFFMPRTTAGDECIYFCGHSLGLQPKAVREYVEQELKDWETHGVDGHLHAKNPWFSYHELMTDSLARLVGAKPTEVVAMNTLTVNLHLMMVSFYRPTAKRNKILVEANTFPSDQYAIASQIRFHGFEPEHSLIELVPRESEYSVRTDDAEVVIHKEGNSIALVLLGGVNYYTGQAFDIERITRAAHAHGCAVGFDMAHAIGNIPLRLHDWGVDFAVWCSYKYLNGGPGCVGGCFVHEKNGRNKDIPRFTGWWGHDKVQRFQMDSKFKQITGAEGWQLSNPPILPLAALRASLAIFQEAGMERLREKSELLTGYLEYLVDLYGKEICSIITPRNPKERGAQLSVRFRKGGREIFERLTSAGVVCDWREPDVLRLAPVPLYNRFTEVFRFHEIISAIFATMGLQKP